MGARNWSIVVNQLVSQFREKLNSSFFPNDDIVQRNAFFECFDEARRPIVSNGNPKVNDRLSLEDDNIQRGLYLSLWPLPRNLNKRKLLPIIDSELSSLSATSQSFSPCFGPQHQFLGCCSTYEVMSSKKTRNRKMRDRLFRAEAVEFGLQFQYAQKSVFFCTFLRRNLSSRFDSFLGLPDLGFGKTVPYSSRCWRVLRI